MDQTIVKIAEASKSLTPRHEMAIANPIGDVGHSDRRDDDGRPPESVLDIL